MFLRCHKHLPYNMKVIILNKNFPWFQYQISIELLHYFHFLSLIEGRNGHINYFNGWTMQIFECRVKVYLQLWEWNSIIQLWCKLLKFFICTARSNKFCFTINYIEKAVSAVGAAFYLFVFKTLSARNLIYCIFCYC